MRKNDPIRRTYWVFFICEGIVFVLFLLQVVLSIAAGNTNYFLLGYSVFFILLLILAFFAIKRKHQRTEERREHALSGDASLLAQPQPVPDAQAIPLPANVGLHISIKYILELNGALCILVAVAGAAGFIAALKTHGSGHTVPSIVIPLFIGIIVAFLFITFVLDFLLMLIIRPLFEQEITLDEQGITTKFYRQTTQIPWNEVQSFAMWGNAKRFSTIQFELISDHGVARWFQIGSPRKVLTWLTMLKPNLPYDEYRAKMAAIQQVIIARTGKPLYDLRDEKIVWW